jgi:hypothetical protein
VSANYTVRNDGLDQARRQAQIPSRWDKRLAAIKQIAEAAHNATGARRN